MNVVLGAGDFSGLLIISSFLSAKVIGWGRPPSPPSSPAAASRPVPTLLMTIAPRSEGSALSENGCPLA